jgi:phosphate:Na+ symporter
MEKVNIMETIFMLFGGLAIFIYGMNLMGDGLQKTAGERMRKVLKLLTKNPIIGVCVGTLLTMLLQSSSATTVMVIGFVTANLMTLPQAIGVIMGANIGTSSTAQLVAFKIGNYAYPIAAIGFIMYFFPKKKIIKYVGQTIFAFGLLFIGLKTMSSVMKPLTQIDAFKNILTTIKDNSFLGLLAGTFMTVIVQSSSAVIAMIQNLAATQVGNSGDATIPLRKAFPMLLGSNIGTTITAILASIGARVNAKRAALAHSIFNIAGAAIFIWLVGPVAAFVEKISPSGSEFEIVSRQIANAHSTFNIINTLIWLPFVMILAKAVTFIIRGNDEKIEQGIRYLDNRMLSNPSIAMNLVTDELSRMATIAKDMVCRAFKAFESQDLNEVKNVIEIEGTIDTLQYEITKYLSTILSQESLTEHQSLRMAGLMHITGDIERIGDHCENIAEIANSRITDKIPFSDEAIQEIIGAFNQISESVNGTIKALHDSDIETAKAVIRMEDEFDILERKLRETHIKRLENKLCNPKTTITFIELIHNLEKISDHCKNIAEAVIKDKENDFSFEDIIV